jgi:hypothetical protein
MSGFRILPEVTEDIAEAANWYDEKGYPGLGERFIDTFLFVYPSHCGEWRDSPGSLFRFPKDPSSAVPVFSLLSL